MRDFAPACHWSSSASRLHMSTCPFECAVYNIMECHFDGKKVFILAFRACGLMSIPVASSHAEEPS